MARRLRGRAWGNALGGYKRQRRDSKGRFASGKVGGRARSTVKRAKKRYNNRGGSVATRVRTASKVKYNKSDLNKQLQNNHRLTLAGNFVGVYGGAAAGSALGAVAAGPAGAMVGRKVGAAYGHIAVGTALRKSGRLVTDQQFMKAGKADQAAMARRIKRARKGHAAINMAGAAYGAHRAMKLNIDGQNGYDLAARIIRDKKKARARKGRNGMWDGWSDRRGIGTLYASKRNRRGVYNISSMGPRRPFM